MPWVIIVTVLIGSNTGNCAPFAFRLLALKLRYEVGGRTVYNGHMDWAPCLRMLCGCWIEERGIACLNMEGGLVDQWKWLLDKLELELNEV